MSTTVPGTQISFLDRGAVEELQSDRLRTQLAYVVAESPFYRDKFAAAGVDPASVRSTDDLHLLPFTDKSELRDSQKQHPPLGSHAAASMRDVVRVHASSGTTGRPSYVGVTAADADAWGEVAARVFECQGLTADDIVLHALGLGFFVGGLPLVEGVQRLGATSIPIGIGATDRLIQSTRDLAANVLFCTPSFARYLAEHMREKLGLDPRTLGFTKILVGAEPGGSLPAVRAEIEANYGAPVYESIGNADVFPIYSSMCEAFEGNHLLAEDHVAFEVIDPETGDVLPWEDGVEGELVTTHLTRNCVPLVRFRTRDRVLVRTSPCLCGRTSPRITCIGRTDDLLIVNGVNVWPSAVSDVVSSFNPRTTGAMEIVIAGEPPIAPPPLRIRVEYSSDATDLVALKSELEAHIREALIARASVELVPAGTLQRSEAKSRLVRIEPAGDAQ